MIHTTAKIFRACLLALMPAAALAQTATQNYTKTTTYREAGSGRPAVSVTYYDGLGRPIQKRAHGMSATGKDIVTHIQYDAAGRQAREYLPFVSQSPTLDYSPSAATDLSSFYGSPNPAQTGNPTFEATGNPYSEKLFETSPLGRVLKQAAPGNAWKMPASGADPDHTVKTDYLSNSVADGVRLYRAANGPLSGGYYPATLSQQGTYPAGTLYKTVLKDENWTAGNSHTTQEFKNKEGKVVLKRAWGSSTVNNAPAEGWHDTYYVYDDFGNLAFVLPPLSDGSGSQPDLNGLCYQYRYDEQKRLVEKKLPGKQWEYILYDGLDRVIATGPALSPFKDIAGSIGWLFTKYDVFGRVAYTGWMPATVSGGERNSLQAARNAQTANLSETKTVSDNNVNGVTFPYTNHVWPTGSGWHVLTVNYYDDYAFPGAPAGFGDVEAQPVYYNLTVPPKGLTTGSWTRIPETTAQASGETSYMLYDYKARPIRTYITNYFGGYTQTDSKLDFSGKVLYTVTTHKKMAESSVLTVREDFTYTDQDRLLTHTHKINARPTQLLANNRYDELGQLISKKTGGTDLTGSTPFQKVDYTYTVRGWLKGINDTGSLAKPGEPTDLFAFGIGYDTVSAFNNYTGMPLFNGNISETHWTGGDGIKRSYSYGYDALNRLLKAAYIKGATFAHSYDEDISYDKNGNIHWLKRMGHNDDTPSEIDDIDFVYDTQYKNRLMRATDQTLSPNGFKDGNTQGDDYAYDDFGNLTKDLNKGITQIIYNHLNLPIKILFGSEAWKIEYLYTADGRKVWKSAPYLDSSVQGGIGAMTMDYLGGFHYQGNSLLFFPTAEGYIEAMQIKAGYSYSYVFNHKDHLGNVRMSYTEDPQVSGSLKIVEENHYYPFGLKHAHYSSNQLFFREGDPGPGLTLASSPLNPVPQFPYNYKYNGKQWQDEMGLDWYDYGARNYDPALGRWMNIDPLAEKHYRNNPYMYANNNPTAFKDPDGKDFVLTGAAAQNFFGQLKNQVENDGWIQNWITRQIEYHLGANADNTPYGYTYRGENFAISNGNGTNTYTYFFENGIRVAANLEEVLIEGTYTKPFTIGDAGIYGPYIPDAIGMSVNSNVKGVFGQFSFNFGFAFDRHHNFAVFGGTTGNLGFNGGMPGFSGGLSLDLHDNYGGNTDVLGGLGGYNRGYAGSLLFGGAYSESAKFDGKTFSTETSGVSTKSINLGTGWGGGTTTSYSTILYQSN